MVIKIIINEDHVALHGPFKIGKKKKLSEPVFYTLSFCIYEGYWWSCKSNQVIWITENDQNDSCMRKEIFICLK